MQTICNTCQEEGGVRPWHRKQFSCDLSPLDPPRGGLAGSGTDPAWEAQLPPQPGYPQ